LKFSFNPTFVVAGVMSAQTEGVSHDQKNTIELQAISLTEASTPRRAQGMPAVESSASGSCLTEFFPRRVLSVTKQKQVYTMRC